MAEGKDEEKWVLDTIQRFRLGQDQELRFEVSEGMNAAIVTMVNGIAEIFGTEMVRHKRYRFMGGTKLAIFTYHGCSVVIKGKTDIAYVAIETPMNTYLNCHGVLETLRRKAEADGKRGPIVLVVGPHDVGKSTVCRILLNYAVRLGRRPIFVDLDVGQGNISVPGTIGATVIEIPETIEDGGFSHQTPLSYFLGHKTPSANIPLYHKIISRLAENVHERMEGNRTVKTSGAIVNTCGWVKGDGYRSILHIVQAIEADLILVLDQERLYNELRRDIPAFVKVVLLPKSGGAVARGPEVRQEIQDSLIKEYFYGKPGPQSLHPYSFHVKFTEARIFKIGAPAVPSSCMPLGMKVDA